MSRTTAFPWYGSKYTQVPWLKELLPRTDRYVEPFGGSGVVLINREPVEIETFNDLNSEVVNFFDVVRQHPDELRRRVKNTPHSREMYERSVTEDPDSDIQQALYFLIRVGQSFGGAEGSGWARSIGTSRRGMAQRPAAWEYRAEQIDEVAERLKRVQIENTDAVELIEDHDHVDCTFYCDPPYPPSARNGTGQYEHEFDEEQHRRLADTLHDCDGYVAVSGYACDLLDELYADWNCYSEGEKTLAGKGTGAREEVLYTNYDANTVTD